MEDTYKKEEIDSCLLLLKMIDARYQHRLVSHGNSVMADKQHLEEIRLHQSKESCEPIPKELQKYNVKGNYCLDMPKQ